MSEIQRLERECAALRACALKYLAWLNNPNPEKALAEDVRDPGMIGKQLARELSRRPSGCRLTD